MSICNLEDIPPILRFYLVIIKILSQGEALASRLNAWQWSHDRKEIGIVMIEG